METETLETKQVEENQGSLENISVSGVKLKDGKYLTSEEIMNSILESDKKIYRSDWGQCVWGQCNYSRK